LTSGPGFKGRGANWAVAQGPPQLNCLPQKTAKKSYLRKHKIKIILFETDNTEGKFLITPTLLTTGNRYRPSK